MVSERALRLLARSISPYCTTRQAVPLPPHSWAFWGIAPTLRLRQLCAPAWSLDVPDLLAHLLHVLTGTISAKFFVAAAEVQDRHPDTINFEGLAVTTPVAADRSAVHPCRPLPPPSTHVGQLSFPTESMLSLPAARAMRTLNETERSSTVYQ